MAKDIMEHFSALVPFLGKVLGNNCEIALLDLRENKHCITTIAHGHISGRQVGAPITDLALSILNSGIWHSKDFECNYTGNTKDNRHLRSSSYFIKEEDKILGMLCINIDDSRYRELSEAILELGGIPSISPSPFSSSDFPETSLCLENFTDNITDMIESVIADYSNLHNIPLTRLTQEEKIALVEEFQNNGIFLIKGSVPVVAEKLHCSEATVYRYLSKIQKTKKTLPFSSEDYFES